MRGRWIKPETWSSRTLSLVSREARLLFIGLWCYADDEGRGIAEAREIRLALFRFDEDVSDLQIDAWLAELADAGLIRLAKRRLKRDTKALRLLEVSSFAEHQRVDRPTPSRLPSLRTPPKRSSRTRRGLDDGSSLSSKEVKRKEVKAARRAVDEDRSTVEPQTIEAALREEGAPDLFGEVEAPAPDENGNGYRRPAWSEKPNPWEKLDEVVEEIGREP